MTDKEAMAMALDALETEVSIDWTNINEFVASAEKMHEAITALKARLAQPEQEPPQRTKPLIGCVNHDCDKCKESHDRTNKNLDNTSTGSAR